MTTLRPHDHTVTLILDSRLEDVYLAGLAVRGLCLYTPLDAAAVRQVELCVVEAVTNAVKHAYGEKTGNEIRVAITLEDDRIEFAVRDRGYPMKSLTTPDPVYDRDRIDALPESGVGLFIIRSVMDSVSYCAEEPAGNVLRMTKLFPPKA